MALPSPESYNDWREYAHVLTAALEAQDPTAGGSISLVQYNQTLPPSVIPQVPDGWRPVWWSIEDALLYMGNSAYDPPTAPDLFQIDTASLADAAVTVQKVADLAITLPKIANQAVATEKMALLSVDATILANLAVTNGKLVDGAVGTSKIANLAVDTAKINDLAVVQAKIGLLAVGAAQIGLLQVGTGHIVDGAIVNAKIGDAQVLTAKIGDLQVVTAKIDDLAVNSAKMANLAVTSAKIALLAVGNTHIQDAAITRAKILDGEIINAKIANVIESSGYDGTNGWQIDKTGSIRGTNITILKSDGSVAFSSGSLVNLATQVTGLLANSSVAGLGSLALLNSITPANTTGFGALALKDFAALGTDTTGTLPLTSTTGNLDITRTTGFGTLAAVSLLTSGNISTYIAGAAIGGALIATAAIGTAHIDNAAITTAKIGDLQVDSLKIANKAVSSTDATYNGTGSATSVTTNTQDIIATVSVTNTLTGSVFLVQGGARLSNLGLSGDPNADHIEGQVWLEYRVNGGTWTRDTAIGTAEDRFYSVGSAPSVPLEMRTNLNLAVVGMYSGLGQTTGQTVDFRIVGWATGATNGWPWNHRRGYVIATELKK